MKFLQYGQVPGEFLAFSLPPREPGIAGSSCQSDIYLGEGGGGGDLHAQFFFWMLNFHGRSHP